MDVRNGIHYMIHVRDIHPHDMCLQHKPSAGKHTIHGSYVYINQKVVLPVLPIFPILIQIPFTVHGL